MIQRYSVKLETTKIEKDSKTKGPPETVSGQKNGMLFNVSKCKVMHIGRPQKQNSYFMNNHVSMEKDLGVVIVMT